MTKVCVRSPSWSLCAAIALLGGLAPFGSARGQTARLEIASVEFGGNETFSDTELRRAVLTKASSCPPVLTVTTCAVGIDWFRDRQYFSARVMEDDLSRLRQLYAAHGFRAMSADAEVLANGDGTVSVTFRIEEGQPFRVGSIEFQGDSIPAGLGFEGELQVGTAPGELPADRGGARHAHTAPSERGIRFRRSLLRFRPISGQ